MTWSSTDGEVATIGPTSGILTGVRPGTATISATVDGLTTTAAVVVLAQPVAMISVAPSTTQLLVGEALSLSATLRDGNGNALAGRTVLWSSNAPDVVVVDAGVVRGLSAGTAIVTATTDGVSASSTVVVAPVTGARPSITAVSPAVLVPGGTATITGAGFTPGKEHNWATIAGIEAPVLSATATQIIVSVPCLASVTGAPLHLVSGSLPAPATMLPVAGSQRSLMPGQAAILGASQLACTELVTDRADARYLVAVYSTATSAHDLTDFELTGNPLRAGESASQGRMQVVAPTPASTRFDPARALQSSRDRAHLSRLDQNRRDYDDLRARAARLPAAALRATAPVALPGVGTSRTLYFTHPGGCQDASQVISARAIYVGAHAIIWEDATNPLLASRDAALADYYGRLGRIFDQDQYEIVRRHFGDPLLRDGLTDGDARVHLVFTHRVNAAGAAALVTTCDQYPAAVAAGSNVGQFLYGMVPTTSGSNLTSAVVPDGWFSFMARTVVHELKHIASLSSRIARGAPLETNWLEEGTARHAEEIWVRDFVHRTRWKTNAGFGTAATNGVFCDFHPENTTCNTGDPLRRPTYGVRRQFSELREKLEQPWNWSIYGDGAGQSGSVFYQTVWSLVRYTIDRYGASDAAFLSALTNSAGSGLENLAAVAGVPSDQLLGEWGLALAADDYPGLVNPSPSTQIATWNLRDIYARLHTDPTWKLSFSVPYPLRPAQLSFGSFAVKQYGVRGAAHAYFEISGTPTASQMLRLRSGAGGPASPALRIAIARLR